MLTGSNFLKACKKLFGCQLQKPTQKPHVQKRTPNLLQIKPFFSHSSFCLPPSLPPILKSSDTASSSSVEKRQGNMIMLCPTCQTMQRTNSQQEIEGLHPRSKTQKSGCTQQNNWSGCLGPRAQDNATKCKRKGRKLDFGEAKTVSNGEPRLVRSSGMRRDWSFEDPSKSSIGPRF